MTAVTSPCAVSVAGGDELDELTLRRAQRGERDAWRALVERYQRAVFALLGRLVGRGGAALVEDVAQETFLHVFRALPGFTPLGPARLSTWILTIAARRGIDELRRRAVATDPLERGAAVADEARADTETERARLAHLLEIAVAALSPELRAAFLLREYHDLEYADIARALEIEIGTVKSRLSRARAALRASLAEGHDD